MRCSIALFVLVSLSAWAQPPGAAITPANVARVNIAWTYDTGDSIEPVRPGGRPPKFETMPVYDSGQLYLSTPAGSVIALGAETGKEVWKINLHLQHDANYGDFVSRGLALQGDKLYVATWMRGWCASIVTSGSSVPALAIVGK